MGTNVLNYEPAQALFVPDHNPLLFYKAIAELGRDILLPEGFIYCEINESLPEETRRIFYAYGYKIVTMRRDINGKPRMIRALKN
jgi:release factor glutamine methyltransferase